MRRRCSRILALYLSSSLREVKEKQQFKTVPKY
jgi:hypothetical protein